MSAEVAAAPLTVSGGCTLTADLIPNKLKTRVNLVGRTQRKTML
jgi:hypothetical protein